MSSQKISCWDMSMWTIHSAAYLGSPATLLGWRRSNRFLQGSPRPMTCIVATHEAWNSSARNRCNSWSPHLRTGVSNDTERLMGNSATSMAGASCGRNRQVGGQPPSAGCCWHRHERLRCRPDTGKGRSRSELEMFPRGRGSIASAAVSSVAVAGVSNMSHLMSF